MCHLLLNRATRLAASGMESSSMTLTQRLSIVFILALATTSLSVMSSTVRADGHVLLTISGKIAGPSQIELDFETLSKLGTHTVKTETKWTDGEIVFEGPLLRDVLAHVGATGTEIKATAINDYAVDIPVSDATAHDVILAHTADGKRMRIRDKGPLWVIYPWSDDPELADERIFSRSIWQLNRIEIR